MITDFVLSCAQVPKQMMCDPISDLEPPSIKEELQQGEYGHVEVEVMTWIALSWVQKLATN